LDGVLCVAVGIELVSVFSEVGLEAVVDLDGLRLGR